MGGGVVFFIFLITQPPWGEMAWLQPPTPSAGAPPQAEALVKSKLPDGDEQVYLGGSSGAGYRDRSLIIVSCNMGKSGEL